MINITTSRRKIMKTQPSCTSRYINQANKFKHGAQVKKYFFQLVLCFLLLLVMGKFKIYYIIMRETKKGGCFIVHPLLVIIEIERDRSIMDCTLYLQWDTKIYILVPQFFNHRTLFFLFFSSLMLEEEREITKKGRDEINIFQLQKN